MNQYRSIGLQIDNAAQNATWENLELYASASGSTAIGVRVQAAGQRFSRVTISANGLVTQDKAILNENINFFDNIHIESHTYGLYCDDAGVGGTYGAASCVGIFGNTTVSTLVYLNTTASVFLAGLVKNGATTAINDITNGYSTTDTYVPLYANYNGGQPFGAGLHMASAIYPATPAKAQQLSCAVWAGSGVPSNSVGTNGDMFFDAANSGGKCLYQKRSGTWTAVV